MIVPMIVLMAVGVIANMVVLVIAWVGIGSTGAITWLASFAHGQRQEIALRP